MKFKKLAIIQMILSLIGCLKAETLYEENFDNDGLSTNKGVGGGAISKGIGALKWIDNGNGIITNSNRVNSGGGALLYSKESFTSSTGFVLTVSYKMNSLQSIKSNKLSFGLISNDSNISEYSGANPFMKDTSVYSIGANVTAHGGADQQGLHFSNQSKSSVLDQSGTRVQFKTDQLTEVSIEIDKGGYWCYRINGVYEVSLIKVMLKVNEPIVVEGHGVEVWG